MLRPPVRGTPPPPTMTRIITPPWSGRMACALVPDHLVAVWDRATPTLLTQRLGRVGSFIPNRAVSVGAACPLRPGRAVADAERVEVKDIGRWESERDSSTGSE